MYDVAIVGAGLAGVVAAQRYLDAHPMAGVIALERDSCVGGVFNRRRLYPGFYTQWTFGVSEFSDMRMRPPPEEDCIEDCYKAKYFTDYIEKYVDEKIHDGRSLRDRIRFEMDVINVEKINGLWKIVCKEIKSTSMKKDNILTARMLMVAAGEYSTTNIPDFPGQDAFDSPIVHSSDFGESQILFRPDIDRVTVLGAGKSAVDMLYESIKSGKLVNWIIRRSGAGPGCYVPVDLPTPYKNGIEAAQTRVLGILQPCILHKDGWWVWFLHRTLIGVAIVTWIFGMLDIKAKKKANYHGRHNEKGFEKLDYSPGLFWQNNASGALHHTNFWDLVAENVTVYRNDVTQLSSKTIHLDDGTRVPCDALLLGTGWRSSLDFFTDDLKVELGLPHDQFDKAEKWTSLDLEADIDIVKRFPMLGSPPPHHQKQAPMTPYRLYNGIAPLHDNSIVFINHLIAENMIFNAEAQAMWAVAYLDGNVNLPSLREKEKDVATWVMYCRRRYLSNGLLANYAPFDMIVYVDKLMMELGVKTWWKGWGKDAWEVNRPEDLGRAWKEYLEKRQSSIKRF